MANNRGYEAGIGQVSAAKRLAWALSGAPLRKKDLKLTPIGALAEACRLRQAVTDKCRAWGVEPNDIVVAPIFADSRLSQLVPRLYVMPVECDTAKQIKVVSANATNTVIGMLVFVWDRESQNLFGHARPLIVNDPRALSLNAQAVRVFGKHIQRAINRKRSNA